jgi:hypothetical protein
MLQAVQDKITELRPLEPYPVRLDTIMFALEAAGVGELIIALRDLVDCMRSGSYEEEGQAFLNAHALLIKMGIKP